MFSTLGLFARLACPDGSACKRTNCLFSHERDLLAPVGLTIPVESPAPARPVASTSSSSTVPAKRPGSPASPRDEPPRKSLKVAPNRAVPAPRQQSRSSGPPVLRVIGAQSAVPVPVRSALLKTLYEHFMVLYDDIPNYEELASEHALRQELEIYEKSNRYTYRNAVIACCASIKRRPNPTSVSHPSVGTEAEIAAREEALKTRKALRLTRSHLEPLVLSRDDLKTWGFVVDIPSGAGGDEPSIENKISQCERCGKAVPVKRMEDADKCVYHWGKPISQMISGQRTRIFRCCSMRTDGESEGCSQGPHVFYESKPELLHARHAFSLLKPGPAASTVLDVAALDCEMIYTTGGMRVARVSVVDGAGDTVFDELVRMDDGVHVIDFNTRFSGITAEEYEKAVLPLASIREALDEFINRDTILIGHGLENDLNTLRIVHLNNVDTAILFKHPAGPPYRKALRHLAREHLGITIQAGGGSVGHSSLEDCLATLDLVKSYVSSKNAYKG
ncbi:Exonuclease domain-containing protein [Mycena chlorophos]|uniref:Exonuclease domain-containing protein n=1 Tax=Mycena chlorophos TaxID=658473 RepID=A0A8H6S390_MYCCL|nr:Exonuclease domain-containing protein [Mycena chlorophos]